MKKYIKIALYVVLALLLLAQFIRPERNLSNDQTHHIATRFPVPAAVEGILKTACYDCHSNLTVYPWYANIQPVASWLANHVDEGKRELNFSNFTTRKIAVQNHKMEEVIEMVRENEMPLSSYTWVHRDAMLSAEQKELLISWAQSVMDTLKANNPPDSLILRRR
ncbi:MAG: heme-binding domain-containing protein [Saprospiraceae bacterium]|nr:heme-binding domain-containing protein [Saprospiraceae bacterium]